MTRDNSILPLLEICAQTQHWYAIRVRSNFEVATSLMLRCQDIEVFCPTYRSQRRWSDRTKEIQRPLFPGYVFCRISPLQRVPVLSTAGVVGIVGFGRTPIAIPDHEIEAVRMVVKSNLGATPCPYLEIGHKVAIETGPLAGAEGIVLEIKTGLRLVVSIDILRRSVATEIDRAWIRQIGSSATGQTLETVPTRAAAAASKM